MLIYLIEGPQGSGKSIVAQHLVGGALAARMSALWLQPDEAREFPSLQALASHPDYQADMLVVERERASPQWAALPGHHVLYLRLGAQP
jgi:predicted kinase